MFSRVFFLFALVAAAFASPKPEPQVVAYTAPAVYPGYGYSAYSAYNPLAYSVPYAAGAAYPYAYSGLYVR